MLVRKYRVWSKRLGTFVEKIEYGGPILSWGEDVIISQRWFQGRLYRCRYYVTELGDELQHSTHETFTAVCPE